MSALTTGLLVFARLSGLMLTLPLISARGIPQHVGIFLSLALTLIVAPIVEPAAIQPTLGLLALGLASEIVLGVLLGSVVSAVFASFAIGSDVMSTQMGFAMASIFDPITKAQEGPLGIVGGWLAGLVFMASGLHLVCIGIVADSFHVVGPGAVFGIFAGIPILVDAVTSSIILGMKLAGPVLALVWLVQVFVAILTKMAPKMNVYFSVGMLLISAAGLALFALSLPYLLTTHDHGMRVATDRMAQMIQALY
jgi:flagellar biosynthetic protein FliR